jgi:ectoine hydroxylase-related dioxygenase (phytanoyl-CoA dioxygenase family)
MNTPRSTIHTISNYSTFVALRGYKDTRFTPVNLALQIPMRAGSVLMWDQTMVHGTQPNAASSR